MLNWLRKLLGLNPKVEAPTVDVAWARLQTMVEEFNDLCFYLTQVQGFNPPEDLSKYLVRADYALCSARDELQILIRNANEAERLRRLYGSKT